MQTHVADSRKRAARLLLLGAGLSLIYLAFLAPGIYSLDGNSMLAVAESLVEHHSVAVPAGLGIAGRGGRFYSPWYPLLSFLAVPLVAAGVVAAHWLHLPAHFVAAVCALVLPALVSGATAGLVAFAALELGSTERGAWRAAISYSFATIALVYARTFFAEPLLAFLTVAALCLALAGSPRGILGAAGCAGLAVLAKPTGIVVGPILSAYLLAKRRPAASLLPLLGSLAGLGLYGVYNFTRFGNPVIFGPPFDFSLGNLPTGAVGLLLSPGRGIVWYCPPVVLAVVGFRRALKKRALEAHAILALFLGFLLIHSLWKFWAGGWSWGPRFLLPAIPGLAALLGLLQGKWAKALVALSFAGFLLNGPSLVAFYERYYAEAAERGVTEGALEWSPSKAPLLHFWGAAGRQLRDAAGQGPRAMLWERTGPAKTIATSRALRVVAVWWWVLPLAGISRWAGGGVALVLTILGIILIVRAFPRNRSAGDGADRFGASRLTS